MSKRYGPSPLYIIPSAVIGAVVALLTLAFFAKGKVWGIGFGLLFLVPLTAILLFINFRFLVIKDEDICSRTVFGTRCIPKDQIEKVAVKRLGMRKVLWIQAQDNVMIVPLIFRDIQGLKRSLTEALGNRVDQEGWSRSVIDIALLYLTALFLVAVVLGRLLLR